MKRVEISYNKEVKTMEKLLAKLQRAEKSYEKKLAVAQKYGVAEMTPDEYTEWLQTVPTGENYVMLNKQDIKTSEAWFDLFCAKSELAEVKASIERAEKRLQKTEEAVEQYHIQRKNLEDLKKKEELEKLEFEEEQKEWAKDGITLEARYRGYTPKGKGFSIYRNSGFTERHFHCYTLQIEGRGVVFTSGEFWRAYMEVKNG